MSQGFDIIDRLARPLDWFIGPILDKELRVASRRPRNYLLRFLFICIMAGFIGLAWTTVVRNGSSLTGQTAVQMEQVGRAIVGKIIDFQFWAMQLLAIVLVSNSIGDEVQQQTLGILATTPVSGRQVVMGKLISKLLNLLLFLAVSLPVLAMVRVFGGATLEYIIASLGTTLVAVLLAGAISMLFASKALQPITVVLRATVAYGIIFILFPFFAFRNEWAAACFLPSPVMAMEWARQMLLEHYIPTKAAMGLVATNAKPDPPWAVLISNWIVTAAVSSVILYVAAGRIMDVATEAISGSGKRKTNKFEDIFKFRHRSKSKDEFKSISGSPFIWREMRLFLPTSFRQALPKIILSAGLLMLAYVGGALGKLFNDNLFHKIYLTVYFSMGSFVTLLFASGTICYERQARVLPLLLTTPTALRRIVSAKTLSVFYRAGLLWGLFAIHTILFTLTGLIHPLTAVHLFMTLTGTSMFLCGMSMYASSRSFLASHAMAVCLCMCGLAWAIMPRATMNMDNSDTQIIARYSIHANPFIQIWTTLDGGSGAKPASANADSLDFDWLIEHNPAAETTSIIFLSSLGYAVAGLLLLVLTARRLKNELS